MIGYDGDVDDRAGTGLGTGLGVGVGSPVGPRSGGGGHKYQGLLSELVNNLRPPSLLHSSPPKIVVYVYLSHSFPLCDSYIYPVHTPLSPSPSLSPSFHLTPLYALYTYHSPPPPLCSPLCFVIGEWSRCRAVMWRWQQAQGLPPVRTKSRASSQQRRQTRDKG